MSPSLQSFILEIGGCIEHLQVPVPGTGDTGQKMGSLPSVRVPDCRDGEVGSCDLLLLDQNEL